MLTRRTCLASLAALASARSAAAASFCSDPLAWSQPPNRRPAMPLGDINRRVPWGVAIEASGLYDPALTAALASEKPRFLAIANGLKFGNLHPHPMPLAGAEGDAPKWWECDDTVSLATQLSVPIRGDCLAWNDWLPAWLTDIVRVRAEGWRGIAQSCFERHFESVFQHFSELEKLHDRKLLRWSGVVNEPFNPRVVRDRRPDWRQGAWLATYGIRNDGVPGYIHEAFVLAKKYSPPQTSLFLNETNCDNDRYGPTVRSALLDLLDSLQQAGRKVDAIGLESHLMPQWMNAPRQPDWRLFTEFLRELSKRDVEIYLTELDVNDCSMRDMADRDMMVAEYMRSFVAAALDTGTVTMVTNWDLSDKYSWLRGEGSPTAVFPSLRKWAACVADPQCPRPALYDEAMRPKMSRNWLAEALKEK